MKHYLYTLLILVLFSCSKEEPEKPNTLPKAFEVTANADGTNVTLTWTEAVDADGDAVTYAVVYGADTLTKGLTTRTFTIKDLPYETEISGTVVASDGKGGKSESGFKVKTAESIYVNIPDVEFEKVLIAKKIDDVLDGKVLKEKVLSIETLHVNSKLVKDLTGLEAFRNLTILSVESTSITSLNVGSLYELKTLNLQYNKSLVNVLFGNVSKITTLSVYECNVEKLDISNLTSLLFFSCSYNKIKELNLTKNKELLNIGVEYNLLTTLDLSHNVKLSKLNCDNNPFILLDLTSNVLLRYLYAGNVELTTLKLPVGGKLELLDISKSALEKLDLTGQTSLEDLRIKYSKIKQIDLTHNSKLFWIDIPYNMLTSIDLSNNINLEYLYISSNNISKLDLSKNGKLKDLECEDNELTEICIHKSVTPKSTWKKDASATYKVCD